MAGTDLLKRNLVEPLDADALVARFRSADQFGDLGLQGFAIAFPGVLQRKQRKEGDDGRQRVDDQLPGGEKAEGPAGDASDEDCRCGKDKAHGTARPFGKGGQGF